MVQFPADRSMSQQDRFFQHLQWGRELFKRAPILVKWGSLQAPSHNVPRGGGEANERITTGADPYTEY